jgi:hypothetical protein
MKFSLLTSYGDVDILIATRGASDLAITNQETTR